MISIPLGRVKVTVTAMSMKTLGTLGSAAAVHASSCIPRCLHAPAPYDTTCMPCAEEKVLIRQLKWLHGQP